MKVCVVGLDGATWDLLDPWLDDLPTISSFARGMKADLGSCIPPVSMPAWKCYTTGMDPGDLGVYTFVEPDFEEERFTTVTNETFVHREIWDYLGDADLTSGAINIPGTSPPREIQGWMVGGPFADPDRFATPDAFQRQLQQDGYDIIPDYYLSRDPDDLQNAIASVRGKFDAARGIAEDVDFLHLTIYATDTVQHTEWDSAVSRQFWQDIDRELGAFIEDLDEDWNIVLMSDHGFGKTTGIFYLNTWLVEQGYMELDRSGIDAGDVAGSLGLDYATVKTTLQRLRLTGLIRTILPSDTLVRLARQMPGNRKLEGMQQRIDWSADAIALPPLIYTVDRQTAESIRDELLEVVDRDGRTIIDDVHFGEDVYPHASGRVPDLIVSHGDYVISDVLTDRLFGYDGDWPEHKIAHHRMNGILTARGPDVEDVDVAGAQLFDLAPTILDGFGLDIPQRMRGERLGLLGSRGQRTSAPVTRDTTRHIEHDERVEEQLEQLGYL